jgi:hypothetical protein
LKLEAVEWAIAQKAADNGKYGSARSFKLDIEQSWKKTHTKFWEDKLKKSTRLGILWPIFRDVWISIAITITIKNS